MTLRLSSVLALILPRPPEIKAVEEFRKAVADADKSKASNTP